MCVFVCVFTNRTARLRKEKTSEANQHQTKVHDYYKLHTKNRNKTESETN
jgi:hypothetical protein